MTKPTDLMFAASRKLGAAAENYSTATMNDGGDIDEIAQFNCDDAVQRAIVDTLNAAPALIAEVRALRAAIAEARDLIGNTEHESTCAIGPYNAGQNGADCSCTVGAIAAALEAL